MPPTLPRLPLLATAMFLTLPLHAELEWEKPWQEFDRLPGDPAAEATYTFRNTGPKPVTIRKVKTTCGCTSARLAKKTYAPGEAGAIDVKFALGKRKGPQRKLIIVETDDNAPPTELNIVVRIHEPLAISPSLVFWKTGEPNTPRTVILTPDPATPTRITGVSTSSPRITATLRPMDGGTRHALTVTPADTSTKESARLTVTTDFPPDNPRAYTIHVRIK